MRSKENYDMAKKKLIYIFIGIGVFNGIARAWVNYRKELASGIIRTEIYWVKWTLGYIAINVLFMLLFLWIKNRNQKVNNE